MKRFSARLTRVLIRINNPVATAVSELALNCDINSCWYPISGTSNRPIDRLRKVRPVILLGCFWESVREWVDKWRAISMPIKNSHERVRGE